MGTTDRKIAGIVFFMEPSRGISPGTHTHQSWIPLPQHDYEYGARSHWSAALLTLE